LQFESETRSHISIDGLAEKMRFIRFDSIRSTRRFNWYWLALQAKRPSRQDNEQQAREPAWI